jgi:hypothetical protein
VDNSCNPGPIIGPEWMNTDCKFVL